MKMWRFTLCAAALTMFIGPLADSSMAQRGERGGGRGGDRGGGRSFSGGQSESGGAGGARRGGGESRSGRSASPSRAFSGGEGREGRSLHSFPSSPDSQRNLPREQVRPSTRGESRTPSTQRSFYRGPDGLQSDAAQSDRRQWDRSLDRSPNDRQPSTRPERSEGERAIDRFDGESFRNDRFYDQLERRNQMNDRVRERGRDSDRDGRYRNGDRERGWPQGYFGRERSNDRDWDRYGRDDWRWRRDDIRRNWWRGFAGAAVPFRYGWWDNYYGSTWPVYSPWRYSRWQNQPYYWWGYTPATRLTDWFVFGWDRPRYWAYGPGANIYYRDNYVYYDNQRTVPVNAYYQQVHDLAHSVPKISEAEAERMDWAPLGVFAAMRQNESESQRALQLAVNRDGVLTGTYMNRSNGHVHPVSGMVDERTQRAAWAFADGQHRDVVFETGIYNLTRDEASMMVHFGPSAEDTEIWQLVRLEQPESRGTEPAEPQPASSRALP